MSFNKTKIIATLGPATESKETMYKMIQAGVNVFRINFSHSSHKDAVQMIKQIRELNAEHDYNVAILADLQGPKLRIGNVEEGAVIKQGDILTFSNVDEMGTAKKVFMTYSQFPRDVKVGERILVDDGKILLKIIRTNGIDEVQAEVIHGGPLKSKKGVNLPNTKISLPCLTDKDLADLKVAMEHEVEWIGLSFVRSADDVIELKKIIAENNAPCRVISKIEKPEAVVEIDRIIEETGAIMVARGDLGVEVPMQSVPLIQKMIVNKCHKMSRPVVIATQMMESMIENASPTRAEVNDVANSVLDGADAVMLSGETSVGKHPIKVIEAMTKIIEHVEESGQVATKTENPPTYRNERFITDSICYNASKIADQIGASSILTMSFSGYTGYKISSHRPKSNIIVFTANRSILNMLSLVWGVRGYFYDNMESTDNTFKEIKQIAKNNGLVDEGDLVVKIASMPIEESGTTNMLKISQID
ncbi:pyruvate kinase [Owenweeksia hongkongensis]|uniref:Pyruvate kinase n=1 Tax=Owenweeksia hongkongensis (strain DSM 17368 / CIP 108786 / JCM 12287 / NRRL B-23963 / UST20020801) TaxID=926562 RepID=G8R6A5_OWEHD|nr:pyruvate kinase [Owenweeksia hongkongensis]AEV33325.1 pyruvate kinase [Owenweeksia hongkongensis DSM 17368]